MNNRELIIVFSIEGFPEDVICLRVNPADRVTIGQLKQMIDKEIQYRLNALPPKFMHLKSNYENGFWILNSKESLACNPATCTDMSLISKVYCSNNQGAIVKPFNVTLFDDPIQIYEEHRAFMHIKPQHPLMNIIKNKKGPSKFSIVFEVEGFAEDICIDVDTEVNSTIRDLKHLIDKTIQDRLKNLPERFKDLKEKYKNGFWIVNPDESLVYQDNISSDHFVNEVYCPNNKGALVKPFDIPIYDDPLKIYDQHKAFVHLKSQHPVCGGLRRRKYLKMKEEEKRELERELDRGNDCSIM